MPGTKQWRQAGWKVESVPFHRGPSPEPVGGGAIRQKHSRLLQLRSAPCRTTETARTTVATDCVGRPRVAAARARSAPPQNRIPSRPVRIHASIVRSAARGVGASVGVCQTAEGNLSFVTASPVDSRLDPRIIRCGPKAADCLNVQRITMQLLRPLKNSLILVLLSF